MHSQVISGIIYDNISKTPLEGASIYLDGTTVGTVSNSYGEYQLNLETPLNNNVIISFIGYKTKVFSITDLNSLKAIYLDESPNQLNEVLIEADPWSWEKKIRIFRSEFLGKTTATNYCKILNEKDLRLIYTPSTKTLTAYADKPISIKNKYLGYTIDYTIVDFEIEFKTSSQGLRYTYKVYSSGMSFFSELHKSTKKKNKTHRKKVYYGSLIHFMRSLYNKGLTENGFSIYYKSFPVHPYKYFKMHPENGLLKVTMEVELLSVLYNQFQQSSLEFTSENDTFYIDKNGNHTPPNGLVFGGDFAKKRISNMLPLNYHPNN